MIKWDSSEILFEINRMKFKLITFGDKASYKKYYYSNSYNFREIANKINISGNKKITYSLQF